MGRTSALFGQLLWRLAIAAVVVLGGRHLILTAEAGVAGVSRLLLAMLCFVVAACISAPAVSRLVAELFGDLCSRGGFSDVARPRYRVAADKRARGRYAEAMAELEKISREHPQELRSYVEMIEIAFLELDDQEQGRQVYRRGKMALRNKKDLRELVIAYQKCCALLAQEGERS